MSEKISLTSAHSLRSEQKHDYANSIAETTHQLFTFSHYDTSGWRNIWTGKSETAVITTEQLYDLLKPYLKKDRRIEI